MEREQDEKSGQVKTEKPEEKQKGDWRTDLHNFFDKVRREDETFADHVGEIKCFYADTARPALAEVARELNLYGRECETGEDGGRVFIIVRAVKEKVEFQYAVVIESKIEGITPYVHCWYEEPPKDETQEAGEEQENSSQEDNAQSQSEDDGDKNDEAKEQKDGKGQGDEKKDDDGKSDDKSAAAPKRTKTIEPLTNWSEGRDLQSVTREEIIKDFLAHYKNAVARLRAPLHRASKNQS